MDKITLFPYAATSGGIVVCFTRNGGKIQERRFPPGTTREAILAELAGTPLALENFAARAAAEMDRERQQRAAASQPVTTPSEAEVKKLDDEHDAEIQQLNKMRTALKEAKVKGYQLFKPDTLKAKYAELLKNQSHTQTE